MTEFAQTLPLLIGAVCVVGIITMYKVIQMITADLHQPSTTEIEIDYRARIYIHCNGNLYRIKVFQKTAWIERQATATCASGPNICLDIVEAEAMPYDAESNAWNWTGVYTLIAAYELYHANNDGAAQDAEKSSDKPTPGASLINHLTLRKGLTNEN